MLKTKKQKVNIIRRYYGLTIKEAINYLELLSKEEQKECIDNMERWLNNQSRLAFYND